MKLERIQEKISQLSELEKWEVLCWLDLMLEKAQISSEEKSIRILEEIIRRLPLVIIISLEGGIVNNRCAIILASARKNWARRIAEGIPNRHPFERDFELTPLLKSLIAKRNNGIYIPDPKRNSLVKKQRELVEEASITAIYFVRAKTLLGNIIVAMDTTGTKKEFSLQEREFLDTISRFLGRIESERERLSMSLEQVVQETKINTLKFFMAAVLHLLRNKLMSIGGLCNKIGDDVENGNISRIPAKSAFVTREVAEVGEILHSLAELFYNLSKLETLRLHAHSIEMIEKFLSNISEQASINNSCSGYPNEFFKTDHRKLEKAIGAIVIKLDQKKSPILIDFYQTEKTFSIKVSQCNGDFEKFKDMYYLANTHKVEALSVLSVNDLNLSAYLIILPKISKSFKIEDDHLLITFDLASFE